jgi:hypothetical protein
MEPLCQGIDTDQRAVMEFERIRFELMWRHFEFHARQRTTVFHFFILLTPLLFGGCFFLFKEREVVGSIPAIGAALSGSVLALAFFLLDLRNRQLYQVSKRALALLESQLLFTSYRPLTLSGGYFPGVITQEMRTYSDQNLLKHGLLMGSMYVLAIALFLALAGYFMAVRQGCIRLPLPSAVSSPGSIGRSSTAKV